MEKIIDFLLERKRCTFFGLLLFVAIISFLGTMDIFKRHVFDRQFLSPYFTLLSGWASFISFILLIPIIIYQDSSSTKNLGFVTGKLEGVTDELDNGIKQLKSGISNFELSINNSVEKLKEEIRQSASDTLKDLKNVEESAEEMLRWVDNDLNMSETSEIEIYYISKHANIPGFFTIPRSKRNMFYENAENLRGNGENNKKVKSLDIYFAGTSLDTIGSEIINTNLSRMNEGQKKRIFQKNFDLSNSNDTNFSLIKTAYNEEKEYAEAQQTVNFYSNPSLKESQWFGFALKRTKDSSISSENMYQALIFDRNELLLDPDDLDNKFITTTNKILGEILYNIATKVIRESTKA
jgi:hypothetical protein